MPRNRLLIIAVFVACCWPTLIVFPRQISTDNSVISQQTQNQNPEKGKNADLAAIQNKEASPPAEKSDGKQTAEEKEIHVVVASSPQQDGWYKTYVIATIVLVVFTACTFAAVWYQGKQTAKAAAAASDSAKATRLNVESLINAERPWILIEPARPFSLNTPKSRLDWTILNSGKTVARIIEAKFRCRKFRSHAELPAVPAYGKPIVFHGLPLPPNDPIIAWCYMEPKEGENRELNNTEIGELRERGHELIAYGTITYEDTFTSKIHRSSFCYYYASIFDAFRIDLRAAAPYHECD